MTVAHRRTALRTAAALAAIVALMAVAAPAFAGPPTTGTGSGTIVLLDITEVRVAGGNVFQERSLAGTVEGALEGTYTEEVQGVIHRDGHVTFQATMHFTGTVQGCGTGSFTLGLSGRGVAGVPVTDANVRVVDGGTLGIRGSGTVHQEGPAFTYRVTYTCS